MQGVELEAQGKLEEALAYYLQSVHDDIQNHEICYRIGNLFYKLNRQDCAIEFYRKAVSINPMHLESHINLGVVYNSTQRFDQAIDCYQKAVTLNPDLSIIFYNLGISQKGKGELDKAISCFQKAITVEAECSEAHYNLANTLEIQGEFELATKSYKNAIRSNPKHFKAYCNLGILLMNQDELDEAISCYQKAIEINDQHVNAYNNFAVALMKQGDFKGAITKCLNAVDINPCCAEAYSNLASVYVGIGKFEDALMAYKDVLHLEPDNVTAQYMIDGLSGKSRDAAPKEYIADLFDQYSADFDRHLVVDLDYKLPAFFRQMMHDLIGDGNIFQNAIDLGCGTGLSGQAFKSLCRKLTGVDLSQKMLDKADGKKIYDCLKFDGLCAFLASTQEQYDLFIALEVFIYVGNLEKIFSLIHKRASPKAYFIFSTESALKREKFQLCKTGRYTHSYEYIKKIALDYGFSIVLHKSTEIRKNHIDLVVGDCYILKKK